MSWINMDHNINYRAEGPSQQSIGERSVATNKTMMIIILAVITGIVKIDSFASLPAMRKHCDS